MPVGVYDKEGFHSFIGLLVSVKDYLSFVNGLYLIHLYTFQIIDKLVAILRI